MSHPLELPRTLSAAGISSVPDEGKSGPSLPRAMLSGGRIRSVNRGSIFCTGKAVAKAQKIGDTADSALFGEPSGPMLSKDARVLQDSLSEEQMGGASGFHRDRLVLDRAH
ncbi:MAG: hypothetical protein ACRD25_11500 [Terracidiphilus sp.]